MTVAYVFVSPRSASYKLGQMILPQLEAGTHGVEVAGMFFFDDNVFALRRGDPLGERLARVAEQKGMLLMICDMCALERGLAEGEPRWCDRPGPRTHGTRRVPGEGHGGGRAGRLLPRSLRGARGKSSGSGDHVVG